MQKITLEYLFHTSPSILFEQISTPYGLMGWFAQDIDVNDQIFIFKWGDYRMDAKVTIIPHKHYVRFNWLDEQEGTYTELKLDYNILSKDTSLIVIDFCEDSEEDKQDLIHLWDENIKQLKLRLGLPPKVIH